MTITGRELAKLNDIYRRYCEMLRGSNKPDLPWLLGDLAADERYARLDILAEVTACFEWWSDQPMGKRPRSHKRALRNWMAKAVTIQASRPVEHGDDGMGRMLNRR
jgi:hypothetical protein